MARSGQRTSTASKSGSAKRSNRRSRPGDDVGIIPVLARAVREVESATERGKASPANRTKFQVTALLMREEHKRTKNDKTLSDAERAETLKRLDGIATILAKTAARDTSLLSLLAEGYSATDMAERMGRSAAEVRLHRGNMLRKLNAASLSAAVGVAIEAGLDEDNPWPSRGGAS